ncbi:MAG TPA: hypothetical protein VFU37_15150 [Pyrinomonadaceae bacterium]|nr:hypothetical protein [Pyrinomonadaceae bacterium]
MNRLYQNESSVEELKPLAAYAITETASQDGKVGGPVQMATISAADGCKELPQSEIDAIITSNAQKNTVLKDSFFKGRPNEVARNESTRQTR